GQGSDTATGTVEFDDVKFCATDRMQLYAPRISAANVPTIQTASNDIFFGGKQIGVGSVTLLNQDAFFETLSSLDWINRKCVLKVGGSYLDDEGGAPVGLAVDDYRVAFTGLIQNVKVDDTEFFLDIQDVRAGYFSSIPTRAFTLADFPNVAPDDEGKPRALWFGRKSEVRPIRYDAGSNLGLYEVADTTDAPAGIKEITNVFAYVDKEAAAAGDITRRTESAYKRQAITLDVSSGTTVSNNYGWKSAGGNAWDSGAYASAAGDKISSSEDAYVEATLNRGTTGGTFLHMLGLTTANPDWSFSSLDHAIYGNGVIGTGVYHVYESGSDIFTSTRVIQPHDRGRIWIDALGEVTYWINGRDTNGWELLYTSTVTASGNYFVRLALYTSGAMIAGIGVYRSTALHHTEDLANGRLEITSDLKALEITQDNNKADYSKSSSVLTLYMGVGIYTPDELAFQLGAAATINSFQASTGGSYSSATGLTTLLSTATLGWLTSSGDNKEIYKTLGLTQTDPGEASTSDVGESQVTVDVDKDHIIRCNGQGFVDDGAGTYTGVADGLITVGSDILRTILVAILKNSADVIDEASFTSARGRAPESLGVHTSREWPIKEVMETLEFSNIANIAIGGDGTIYYDVYTAALSNSTTDLEDTDFSAFAVTWEAADVYRTVRSYYDEDPEGNFFLYRVTENPDVENRFGRPEVKEFFTWLTFAAAAQNNSARMSELAKHPAQQLRGTVRGKLLDHRVGQKITVTRDRAAASGGLLSSSVYRIISIRQNHALGLSQLMAVPDVVTVAGVACLTACQSFCEVNDQSPCVVACQESCQTPGNCQTGCETGCQTCEQTTCQETCESACQDACELSDQCGSCQAAPCQTSCQLSTCQTACQKGCETTCEVGCEIGCEVSCEVGCEITCEIGCETGCQTSCEHACQETCEIIFEG
ncbi:hypothetical protein LCGC14_1595170, partial [marine sediment metagenome]